MDKVFNIPFFSIPFSFGDSGVHFFFVLSGFIIMRAHSRDIFIPDGIGKYIKNRIIRIYPTYWIVFILTSLLALFSSALRDAYPNDIYILIKSILLIPQDKTVVGGTGAPVVAVAWTLQYELTFYAFFAALILNRAVSLMVGMLWICAYIFSIGKSADVFPLSFILNDYILLFFFGMMACKMSTAKKSKIRIYRYPMFYLFSGGFIYILLAINRVFRMEFMSDYRTLFLGISSAFLIIGLVMEEERGKIIGVNKWIQAIGDSSYSLYLIHAPLIGVFCKLLLIVKFDYFGVVGAIIAFIAILMACIIFSIIFHQRIELPVIKYLKKF
jgi:peptidoglycan/LPS O-acetylase OafA/YrhL